MAKSQLTRYNLPPVRECHFSPFDEVLQYTCDMSGRLVCLIHQQHKAMLHCMHLHVHIGHQVQTSLQPVGCATIYQLVIVATQVSTQISFTDTQTRDHKHIHIHSYRLTDKTYTDTHRNRPKGTQ